MGLNDVFISAVDTAFQIFADFVLPGKYVINAEGSGWGESTEDVTPETGPVIPAVDPKTECPMSVIVNGLTQNDLRNSKFFTQIQPTDTVIMVKGKDLAGYGVRVRNSDSFEITHKTYTQQYTIIDHETDPASALFLLLLREK